MKLKIKLYYDLKGRINKDIIINRNNIIKIAINYDNPLLIKPKRKKIINSNLKNSINKYLS